MNTESSLSAREQRVNEAIAAYLEAAEAGNAPDRQSFIAAHPEIAAELEAFFADRDHFERLAQPLISSAVMPRSPDRASPDAVAARPLDHATSADLGSRAPAEPPTLPPDDTVSASPGD